MPIHTHTVARARTIVHTHTYAHTDELLFSPNAIRKKKKKTTLDEFSSHSMNDHINSKLMTFLQNYGISKLTYALLPSREKNVDGFIYFFTSTDLTANDFFFTSRVEKTCFATENKLTIEYWYCWSARFVVRPVNGAHSIRALSDTPLVVSFIAHTHWVQSECLNIMYEYVLHLSVSAAYWCRRMCANEIENMCACGIISKVYW